MNHKVLLADDSLTIQKVIKITLANQPYDITDCSNEGELFNKLAQVQPAIVFLDFNLSEKFTGYELTSKIKSICPGTEVLLLLGTFDSVDDASMAKCGASEKIVKPFDSNKFIAICKELIKTSSDTLMLPSDDDLAMPESMTHSEDPDDQWQMNSSAKTVVEEVKSSPVEPVPNPLDALSKEMSDWGMSVPNVINTNDSHEKHIDLPPVIESKPLVVTSTPKNDETKFPDNTDLDYPTLEELEASAAATAQKAKPHLVSLDSLNDKSLDKFEIEDNYVEDVSDVSNIEAQIRDEVEVDLWKADEFEDLKREVSTKIEEMQHEFTPSRKDFDESLFKPLDEGETLEWPASQKASEPTKSDLPQLGPEVEAMVKKYVKEYMDQMFQKNVEKISWEVIPDLAENLIRQELGKIASKIINDHDR